MGKIVEKSKTFLNRNGSTILTWIGAAGVIFTSVSAVKSTPKALVLLENAEKEKGEKLTMMESIQTAGIAYIPSILFGISTIACIFGSNAMNKRTQASLISAYALLDNSYKEYKEKVRELYGEEVDDTIKEKIAKDKYESKYNIVDSDKCLYFDNYSGRYFESMVEDILKAEYELNKELTVNGKVSLNFWYSLLGLCPIRGGDEIGWTVDILEEVFWANWIDIDRNMVTIEGDLECCLLSFHYEPVLFSMYD